MKINTLQHDINIPPSAPVKKDAGDISVKDSVDLYSGKNQTDIQQLNLQQFVKDNVKSQLVNLKFIHINDFHGYSDEFRVPQDEGITGGINRVASEIKKLRNENPYGAITLDGGDIYEGGMYTKFSQGEIVSSFYKHMKFDAGVIGNHDMSWGLEAYAKIANGCGHDFLGANVTDNSPEKHLSFLKPYKVIEKQGVKIGIIGLTTFMTSVGPPGRKIVDIEKPEVTAEKYIKELKEKEHVDMVVVLSHMGSDNDAALAEKVKGIDIIVGAHCHTALKEPRKAGNTILVQAGHGGQYVGNLDIVFDKDNKKIACYEGKLIPVTGDIKPDPEVTKLTAPYVEKYKSINRQVLGKTDMELPYSMTNRTALSSFFIDAQKMDSDLSASSLFCIRKGINKGDITYGDLFNMYPFDNELLQVKTKGESVISYLESGLRFYTPGKDNSSMISGLTYDFNPDLVGGHRITSVTFKGRKYTREEFARLNVTVNMDNYTYGKACFRRGTVEKSYGPVFDVLKDYLKNSGTLNNLSDKPECNVVSDIPDKDLIANMKAGELTGELKYKPNVFCPALKFYGDAIKGKSHMALGFSNSIRAGLPAGEVLQGSLKRMYPFDNKLYTVNMPGNKILSFLENSLIDRYKGIENIISPGIKYEYDSSLPEGERITSITLGDRTFSPAEFLRTEFNVSIDSYLYNSRLLKGCKIIEHRGTVFEALGDYLESNPSIASGELTPSGIDINPDTTQTGVSHAEKEKVRKRRLRELLRTQYPGYCDDAFLQKL
ncbi:MAG: 5'-nucleotidase C-terminal domain-containing protein [Candidatus Eremiobacterota bacterium]